MQWQIQAGDISTNLKVKIYFTFPGFSATKILVWVCCADDFVKDRYDMILGRFILTALALNLNSYEHVIEACGGHLKVSTAPMIDLVVYHFKCVNTGKLHQKNNL